MGAPTLVGIGGVRLRPTGAWIVYYRISPAQQGHGYALEIARAGMKSADRAVGAEQLALLIDS